ncbi:MAG: ATP-binding protein, partial [Endomicrobiaceae bacterium]|nr:ATP-binding protein [Endomicrobiaceae bacterium]
KSNNLSIKDNFEQYIKTGGFPLIALENFEQQSAYQIVSDIYNSVITRDISRRHQIKRQDLFDRVVKFILENIGQTFSANSILKFLKNEYRTISVETIYNYLKWLEDAFIIYKCQRYDLQGKAVLKTQEKYYLADVSLKYSIMGYNGNMVSSSLENIVYLELKRRGYAVYIGKKSAKEIDFVAQKRDEKIYVQVCDKIPEQSDRETNNLLEIKDNYPKYIVTLDNLATGNENGIKIIHITDFLLQERI